MDLWCQGPRSGYPELQLSLGLAASPTSEPHSTCFAWGSLTASQGWGGYFAKILPKQTLKLGEMLLSYKVWSHVVIIWQRKTGVTLELIFLE